MKAGVCNTITISDIIITQCHRFESAQHVTRFYKLARRTGALIPYQSIPYVKNVVKSMQNQDRIFAQPESSVSIVNRFSILGLRLK